MDECLLCALMLRTAHQYIAAAAGAKVTMASFASFRRYSPPGLLVFYMYLNHGFLDASENMEMGRRDQREAGGGYLDRSLQL
jgi:hypothetical protein